MSISTGKLILTQTFFAERVEADKMATMLIEQRLAACAQIVGPVLSIYRWKGELQREEEYMLSIKAPAEHYPKLAAFIGEHHSYEVPEIIAVPIQAVNAAYLDWSKQQCT